MLNYDKSFLEDLMLLNNKKIYAQIILLAYNEEPIRAIEGLITGGSINVDGEASVRRTCSLSMIIQEDLQLRLGLNNKFKLLIGIENTINDNYPEIIWFKQGTFVATNFTLNKDMTKTTLNITGQDKGCLLNGEVSGQFFSDIKLDTLELVDENGNIQYQKLLIKDIIYTLLTEMVHEKPSNIILKDLDETAYELLEYRGKNPLYIICENSNISQGGDWEPTYCTQNASEIKDLPSINKFIDKAEAGVAKAYKKLELGDLAGYHQTKLIYPGDLIMKAGDTVAAALDKIKSMFGTFEYFYNLEGQFVFQKKPLYLETSKNIQQLSRPILRDLMYEDIVTNEKLITQISPSLKIKDLKNDFTVWGSREGVSGAKIPIHARLAIDKKPSRYERITVTYSDIASLKQQYPAQYPKTNTFYIWGDTELPRVFTNDKYDWREIIYQMAMDYQRYHLLDNFYSKIQEANPDFTEGKTGYEQYYTDILGFWRQIYTGAYQFKKLDIDTILQQKSTIINSTQTSMTSIYSFNILENDNKYILNQYKASGTSLYNPETGFWYKCTDDNISKLNLAYQPITRNTLVQKAKQLGYDNVNQAIDEILTSFNIYQRISTNIETNPTTLNFWFDFIEPH